MAIRFDAAGDFLLRTADLPAASPMSMCCWLYLVNDRNSAGAIFELLNGTGTEFQGLLVGTDGTSLRVVSNGATASDGSSLTTGQWYHVGYTRNGATHRGYLNGVLNITHTNNNTITVATMVAGSNTISWIDGRLAAIKIWSGAELTEDEIKAEMRSLAPIRTSNLYAWYPTKSGATERDEDYSANNRDWTQQGTLTDEDQPAIPWAVVDAAGSLTSAGAISRKVGKLLAGAASFAGALVRKTKKEVSGALSSAGALATELIPGGGEVFQQEVGGALTTAGALTKKAGKLLAGALSSSGSLIRRISRTVSGTLSLSGVVRKTTPRLFSGTITSTGNLTKSSRKSLAGTMSSSGLLAASIIVAKLLSGTLSLSGVIVKRANKSLSSTLEVVGNLTRSARKSLSGTLVLAGELASELSGVIQKSVGGVLNLSGSIARITSRQVQGSISLSGLISKVGQKTLNGTLSLAGSLFKKSILSLEGTLSYSGSLNWIPNKLLRGILSTSGSLSRRMTKTIRGVLSFIGSLTRVSTAIPSIETGITTLAILTKKKMVKIINSIKNVESI